jgi:hypothetical protein
MDNLKGKGKTMRRGIISIMFAMFVLCLWSVPAKATPVTTVYEFVPEQSSVIRTGGIRGTYKTFSVEGQFQLTVDYDVGVASFDQVNATLSGKIEYYDYDKAESLFTDSLDVLFELRELESVYVSNSKIDFLLEKNIPSFPGSDVHLTVTFMDNSLQMTGYFGEPVYDGYWYSLDAVAVPEPATLLILVVGGIMLRKRS